MSNFEKEEEVDLFEMAKSDMSKEPDTQPDTQVDLFEYAKQCETPLDNVNSDGEQSESINQNTDLHNDSRISAQNKKGRRFSKIGIALTALVLVATILITTAVAIFINYYNKLDYVADDMGAYYYDVSADDVMSSPFVTNILLIGSDERTQEFSDNARADCTMLMSINSSTHTISLISLERGMMVKYLKSENEYSTDLLTHVFKYGGAGLLMNTVQNTFKVEVNDYVRVNFNTFEQIIDKLGGVDVELSWEEVYGLNTEKNKGQVIKRTLYPGQNHLNGEEALLYARLRWIDSDFQRVERQRKVMLSVKEKLGDASYSQLLDIANDILPLVRTNISADEMVKIIFNISSSLGNDTQQMTVPVKGTYSGLGAIDFDKNIELLQQTLYGEAKTGSNMQNKN